MAQTYFFDSGEQHVSPRALAFHEKTKGGVGGGTEGMTFEEGRQLAKILETNGTNALHVRSDWFGQHQGSYHHEVLFYPEPTIPLKEFPRELE